MKKSFKGVIEDVIRKSNIVLEILDARFIDETRNIELEKRIKNRNNVLIFVINKCDYVDKKKLLPVKKKLKNCVFVSATKFLGTTMLKNKIMIEAKKKKIKNPVVAVIGYPNTGKSSIINALKKKGSAKTSPQAGFTKGMQLLRINKDIMMIDTPGIIPKEEIEDSKLVLLEAKNISEIKDPDLVVMDLINQNPLLIEKHYGIKPNKDVEKTIESIALKINMVKKGGKPDIDRASRRIIRDWQNGKILKK
ncbi:MAG: 50S ribosome-binding GTPase [Nanoarchaeota archaeon]|nr:50S ribosome-binding GTPase [Nanoarchaeota archaeon]